MSQAKVIRMLVAAFIFIGCSSLDVTQGEGSPQPHRLTRADFTSITTVHSVMRITLRRILELDSGRVWTLGIVKLGNQMVPIVDSSALYDKPRNELHLYALGWLDSRNDLRLSTEPYAYGMAKPYRVRENIVRLDVGQIK